MLCHKSEEIQIKTTCGNIRSLSQHFASLKVFPPDPGKNVKSNNFLKLNGPEDPLVLRIYWILKSFSRYGAVTNHSYRVWEDRDYRWKRRSNSSRPISTMIGRECGQLNGCFASDNSLMRFIISFISNVSPALTADLHATVIKASSIAFGSCTSVCGSSGSLSNKSVTVCAATRVGSGDGIARIRIVFPPNSSKSKPSLLKMSP